VTENGILVTVNNGTPADSNFTVKFQETALINSENQQNPQKYIEKPICFEFDADQNIFILDQKTSRIRKYDKSGKFLLAFGGTGSGTGQFTLANSFSIRKDTLFVFDWIGLKVIKFDLMGNCLFETRLSSFDKFPADPRAFGGFYVNIKDSVSSDLSGKSYTYRELSLFDQEFNLIRSLHKNKYPNITDREYDPAENTSLFTLSDSLIYIYENSKDDYSIDVYNKEGTILRRIKKDYSRIKMTAEEMNDFTDEGARNGKRYRAEYKNSVNYMFIDKYDRLWVNSSSAENENGLYFDIFENDIFLKRIRLDIDDDFIPLLIAEKIIAINRSNNFIKTYEYTDK
jgi:hypothetical protein